MPDPRKQSVAQGVNFGITAPGTLPRDVQEFLAFRERWIAEQMRGLYSEYPASPGFEWPGTIESAGMVSRLRKMGYEDDDSMSYPDRMVGQLRQYMNQQYAQQEPRSEGIFRRLLGIG